MSEQNLQPEAKPEPKPEVQPELPQDVRQWAMFCHFAAFIGLIFPFGNLLGPLIVWQIKKDLHPFVDDQGKEALNFQISVALAALPCFLLMVVVIGFPLLALLTAVAMVLAVIAGVKANEGQLYRYPFSWRLVR